MAQVIIRLINSDIPVWITTHSDTILQHINNMLKLGTMDKSNQMSLMQKFGYSKKDLLNVDDVWMYQFDANTENTRITQLERSEYGFVVPTFNDALQKMLDEVYALDNEEMNIDGD